MSAYQTLHGLRYFNAAGADEGGTIGEMHNPETHLMKLAAARRLAATGAHEVNNPLEALVNFIYLAQHAKGLEEAAGHLRLADSELRRITHVVRQTLGFYRESTHPQSTGLLQLVSEVLEL